VHISSIGRIVFEASGFSIIFEEIPCFSENLLDNDELTTWGLDNLMTW